VFFYVEKSVHDEEPDKATELHLMSGDAAKSAAISFTYCELVNDNNKSLSGRMVTQNEAYFSRRFNQVIALTSTRSGKTARPARVIFPDLTELAFRHASACRNTTREAMQPNHENATPLVGAR